MARLARTDPRRCAVNAATVSTLPAPAFVACFATLAPHGWTVAYAEDSKPWWTVSDVRCPTEAGAENLAHSQNAAAGLSQADAADVLFAAIRHGTKALDDFGVGLCDGTALFVGRYPSSDRKPHHCHPGCGSDCEVDPEGAVAFLARDGRGKPLALFHVSRTVACEAVYDLSGRPYVAWRPHGENAAQRDRLRERHQMAAVARAKLERQLRILGMPLFPVLHRGRPSEKDAHLAEVLDVLCSTPGSGAAVEAIYNRFVAKEK